MLWLLSKNHPVGPLDGRKHLPDGKGAYPFIKLLPFAPEVYHRLCVGALLCTHVFSLVLAVQIEQLHFGVAFSERLLQLRLHRLANAAVLTAEQNQQGCAFRDGPLELLLVGNVRHSLSFPLRGDSCRG